MKKVKNLVELNKFVGQRIDGNELAIDFGSGGAMTDKLHTNGDRKLRWNGEEIVTGVAYELIPATDTTLGGVKEGERVTIAADGTISADKQEWTDIQNRPTHLESFSNDNTKFQNDTQVDDAITAAVGALAYVEDVDVSDFDATGDIEFIFKNGATKKIRVPSLDLIDDISYNSVTKDIILTKKDGTEISINVADLVDIYLAKDYEAGDEIQILISGNEISAVLIDGTVGKEKLTISLQAEIDNKIDKVSTAVPGNIAVFVAGGALEDSGENLNDFVRKVDDVKTEIEEHNHDGDNSAKVDYNNLLSRPVILFEDDAITSKTYNFGTNIYNVEYVITKGAQYQTGVLKVRYEDILEMDVFGDDVDVSFSLNPGGALSVTGTGAMDVKLLVFFFSIGKKSFSAADFDESFETGE
jgi:hypothetical protein